MDELRRKADLIAIGTARFTRDIGGRDTGSGLAVPVETHFDVQTVLKGRAGIRSLTVRHARIAGRFARGFPANKNGSRAVLIDPPGCVMFDSRPRVQYLMYLTRRTDGAYAPVTGQYVPGYSFFRLRPF